jgi:DNA-binding MarR family transcriptional regulator
MSTTPKPPDPIGTDSEADFSCDPCVRWLSGPEEQAWRAFHFMALRLDAGLVASMGGGRELRYHDYLILVLLTDQADGRIRPLALAGLLGWEKGRLTHQIDKMVDRGMVRRERCEQDKRGAFVVITEAGRQAIAREAPYHVQVVRELFVDRLTAEQMATLVEIAHAVAGDSDECESES